MLEPDVGNNAEYRSNNVRRIQSPAQPCFDHGDIDFLIGKILESYRSRRFEEGRLRSLNLQLQEFCVVNNLIIRNHLTVDANTLIELPEVRGSVKPCSISCGSKHRSDHRRGRPFAVRARDVNRGVFFLRMPEEVNERTDVFQPRLDTEQLEIVKEC